MSITRISILLLFFLLAGVAEAEPPATDRGPWELTYGTYLNLHVGERSPAVEDSDLGAELLLGLDREPTWILDGALVFRASRELSSGGRFELFTRLDGEEGGENPLAEVELTAGYLGYRHGLFRVNVGRVELPLGLENQVRRVGTLRPFANPASDFLRTGGFTSQFVDGVLVSLSPGGFEVSAYAGEYGFKEVILGGMPMAADADAKNVWGGQAEYRWSGYRLGGGYQELETKGGFLDGERTGRHVFASGRWSVGSSELQAQTEWRVIKIRQPDGFQFDFEPRYAQLVGSRGAWELGARYEDTQVTQAWPGILATTRLDQRETWTLAASWAPGWSLLAGDWRLKGEWSESTFATIEGISMEEGLLVPVLGSENGHSFLLTLSYTFSSR